jgi:hypothetical protein
MRNKVFLLGGILASVVYLLAVFVGGVITPGYSHISQYISELIQAGAPQKGILDPLFAFYNVLVVIFGVGLFRYVRDNKNSKNLTGIVGALILLVEGLAGFLTIFFPQDPIGTQITTTGTIHIILASVSSLTSMLSILLIGLWFRSVPAFRTFGLYSFISLAVVFVSGGFAAATIANPTPINGLIERITIFSFLQWLAVIGWKLYLPETARKQVNLEHVKL